MRRAILAIIVITLLLNACAKTEVPGPATPTTTGKAPKKLSETAKLVYDGGVTRILGRSADLLQDAGLPQEQALVTYPAPVDLLPYYHIAPGVLSYPSRDAAGRFAKRIEKIFNLPLSAGTGDNKPETREKIYRTLFTLFLFHELGTHIRYQYKLAEKKDSYDDYTAAWDFSAAMLSSLEKNAPELTESKKLLTSALDAMMKNPPEKLKPVLSPEAAHEWFPKNAGRLTADPEDEIIAFHLSRMLTALRDNNARDLHAFAEKVKTNIKSIRDRIILLDPKAPIREIYSRRTSRVTRGQKSGASGIDTITLDPEGRFYFGRRGTIAALRPRGNVITIIEGRQTRFKPGCFTSPAPGSIVFYEPTHRIMLDLIKKKIHVKAVDLKSAGAKEVSGNLPFVIGPNGAEYIDTGKVVLKIGPDGKVSGRFPVSGVTGGLIFAGGRLCRSNSSHHTVEFLDKDTGKWKILAGVKNIPGHRDGRLYGVAFNEPCGIAADAAGNIYVADSGNHAVRIIAPDGTVRTLAGIYRGTTGSNSATYGFSRPGGVAVGRDGTIYVAEKGHIRISSIGKAKDLPKVAPFQFPDVGHKNIRIRDLSKKIRDMPFTPELYATFIKRANVFSAHKEYDKAIADLNHAIELEPEHAKAYQSLAKLYIKMDKPEAAVASYKKQIALLEKLPPGTYFSNPSYLRAYRQMADLYFNSGDEKSAIDTLKRMLDLHRRARRLGLQGLSNENLANLNLQLGIFALKKGDHKQAVRNLTEAVKLSPKNHKVYGRRGEAYMALGNSKKGFKDLRTARILDNRYAHPHLVLARYYDKKRDYSVALHHFKRYMTFGGKDAGAKSRAEEIAGLIEERKSAMSPHYDTIEEDSQARVWRVRHFQDGTKEKTLIER
jgi:tetratricopeptide (TPR) repeat protein